MISILIEIQKIDDTAGRDSVESLYLDYGGRVKGLALKILQNEDDAEDALGEVFMRIIRYRDRFDGLNEDETVRLLVIYTRSVCFDFLRKKGRVRSLFIEDDTNDSGTEADIPDEVDIPAEIVRKETAQVIRDAIAEMGEPASLIITLRYYQGMKNTEIADMLGLKPASVGTILHRSLKKLKTKLEVYIHGKNQ